MINFRGKRYLLSLVLLCLLASSVALGAPLQIGDTAPLFTLKVLNTEVTEQSYVNLNDYAKSLEEGGKKATFLSFFATYCEPCKRELPYLVELQKAYAAEGFQVVVVTIDKDAAEVAKAKAMVTELGADFPVLNDRFGIVARRYGVESLPMSFLIDQAGMVKMTNDGFGDDGALKLLTQSRMALGLPLGAPAPEPLWPFVGVPPEVQAERDAAVKKAAKKKKTRKKRSKRRKKNVGTKR